MASRYCGKGAKNSCLEPMHKYSYWFFVGLFLFLLYYSAKVIAPFLTAILLGAVLAYLFNPIYERLTKRMRPTFAAIIASTLIVLLLVIPMIFMMQSLVKETTYLYVRTKQMFAIEELFPTTCDTEGLSCTTIRAINYIFSDPTIKVYLNEALSQLFYELQKLAKNILFQIPQIALAALVMIISVYTFLIHGPDIISRLKESMPLRQHYREEIFKQSDSVLKAVFYGTFVTGILQGFLGGIVFWLVGISGPVFWGIVMALLVVLPVVGMWTVWVPAGAWFIIKGMQVGQNVYLIKGIFILITGFVIQIASNIAGPVMMVKTSKEHPFIIIVGLLGGIMVFGLAGTIIGPVILALVRTFFTIYEREIDHINGK